MPNARSRKRDVFVAVLCVLACVCVWSSASAAKPRYTSLTILHTNDIHGHLFPFDYDGLGRLERGVGGAARRATLIRQLKAASKGPVLVMDAGDVFVRGPLGDLLGVPDFEVMNAIPYDIMTLGNNEFKGATGLEGQRILSDRIKQAHFPIVSANVFDRATGKTIVPPCKVIDLDGLKVGVLGLTAPRVAGYEQAKGLEVRDPIATAKALLPQLESEADFIVALTHIGYALDLELAAAVPGIDVIIGGDSHTWVLVPTLVRREDSGLPGWWAGGTIVCQVGEWARSLGVLRMDMRLADERHYRVMGYSGELMEVNPSIQPAEDIERIVQRWAKPFMREVGKLALPVAKKDAAEWVAARMRDAAGAQVGAEPVGGVENGLKAGVVTELDIRSMFPWVNPIVKLKVTGKQLKDFITTNELGLAGAEVRDGFLYVRGARAEEAGVYTLALESFYAGASPALAGAASEQVGLTTREAVTNYVSGKRMSR